jgi:hypothetical protein
MPIFLVDFPLLVIGSNRVASLAFAQEPSMPDNIQGPDAFMDDLFVGLSFIVDLIHEEQLELLVGTNSDDPIAPYIYYEFRGPEDRLQRALASLRASPLRPRTQN